MFSMKTLQKYQSGYVNYVMNWASRVIMCCIHCSQVTDQSHLISKPIATMEKVHSIFKCFLSIIPQYHTQFRRPEENLEKIRILETKMYQELLISGLIIPFYFVCEMCEVFRMNEVQRSGNLYKDFTLFTRSECKWSHRFKGPW